MQIKNALIGLVLSTLLGVGVFTGAALHSESNRVEAATATTVYYAVNTSYTVKCNVNRKGDGDDWATYTMSKNGKTVGGVPVYVASFTDLYDGLGCLQFQLYDGSTWKSQVQPISSWTSASTYNGKFYNGSAWVTYTPDSVTYKVTRYAVCDGGSPVKIDDVTVAEGQTYAVPGKIYRSGYSFGGWYTNTGCTTDYTARAINSNLSIYAKYTSGTWEGVVYIDLRDSGWAGAAANYAILFMDKTTFTEEVDQWSPYVTGTASGEKLVEVSYNLGFEPLQMVVVRYNASYSQASWNSEKWPTDGNKWGQTPDLDFNACVRIGSTVEDSKNLAYLGFPKVIGGNGSWADMVYLTNVKSNGSHNAEYYSTSVTLAVGDEFKIQVAPYASGDYYGSYSTHSSIEDNFDGDGTNNIEVLVAGTYAFYFDSYEHSLYITKVEIAAADEWAQYFLANVGCDSTGANLPTGWSSCATEYAKLSGAAKNIVYGATAKVDGSYVEQAVARYDLAITNHPSLTKFIVNSSDTPRSAVIKTPIISETVNNSNVIMIVLLVSVISLSGVGGYFFFIKKREN